MRILLTCCTLFLLCLTACADGDGDPVYCGPGDSQACWCTDGTEGIQACLGDGSGWGCCLCDDSTCVPGDDDDSSDPLGVDP